MAQLISSAVYAVALLALIGLAFWVVARPLHPLSCRFRAAALNISISERTLYATLICNAAEFLFFLYAWHWVYFSGLVIVEALIWVHMYGIVLPSLRRDEQVIEELNLIQLNGHIGQIIS